MQRKQRKFIVDIEANGLKPDKIWCLVAKDIETNEITYFKPKTPFSGHVDWIDDFKKFAKNIDVWIGHNLIGYDVPWINRLLGLNIQTQDVEDTLVMSRLFRPVSPFPEVCKVMKSDTRQGGHSLEAWGKRLGYPKIDFNDFSMYTEAMLEYCIQDVNLNHEVYKKLLEESVGFSRRSIRLEHMVAELLNTQQENGFYLDREKALKLKQETDILIEEMLLKLRELFPPMKKPLRIDYEPKKNKDGTMSKVSQNLIDRHTELPHLYVDYNKEKDTYTFGEMVEFNPGSGQQIAERLLLMGWKPKYYTDKGNPKTSKDALAEAIHDLLLENPDKDDLRFLENYGIVTDRNQKATKWLTLVEEDKRVHGNINPIGAGTHRCSHFNDNMANIASVTTSSSPITDFDIDFKTLQPFDRFDTDKIFLSCDDNKVSYALTGLSGYFGWDSRDCWSVPDLDKNVLVGADASGIQLRALAHYMNDPEYTANLIDGDIHTVHQKAAGIATRPIAKTFIYAWLLGAGDPKIGSIVGVEESEYEALFDYGEKKDLGYTTLIRKIASGLKRNNVKVTRKAVALGIKGFKVKEQFLERTPALKRLKEYEIPEATKKGYLVGLDGRKLWIPNEHLAMSLYLQGFEAVIMKYAMCIYSETLRRKNIPFKQVNFVHDEFQVETPKEYAHDVGQAIVDAIRIAGEKLKSNCPLDGEYKIGRSWAETH